MSSRVYGGMLNLFLPSLISLKAISALGCFHGSLARLGLARLVRDRLRACIVCPLLHLRLFVSAWTRSITDADSVWSGGSAIGLARTNRDFYTIPVNQPLSGRIFHRRTPLVGPSAARSLINRLAEGARSGGTARFEWRQWLARKWDNYAPSHHIGKPRRLPHLSEPSDLQLFEPSSPAGLFLQKPISWALICRRKVIWIAPLALTKLSRGRDRARLHEKPNQLANR